MATATKKKQKRTRTAANGEGSITQMKDKEGNPIKNRWRVCVTIGQDLATGKQRRKTCVVNGTKAQAREKRDELLLSKKQGLRLDRDRITYAQLTREWLQHYEESGEASPRVVSLNKSRATLICEYVGNIPIRDFNADTVEALIRAIRIGKAQDGCPIGGTTLHEYFQLAKRIMQRGVDYDYILRNPFDRVKAPKKDEPDRISLTLKEAALLQHKIVSAQRKAVQDYKEKEARQVAWGVADKRAHNLGLRDISNTVAARLGLATGMRRSEVLGLTWDCINLETGLIHVSQALGKDSKLKTTKTKAGNRSISIDPGTLEVLREWKEMQATELAKFLCITDKNGKTDKARKPTPVCCNNLGGFLNPGNFGNWWRAWADALEDENGNHPFTGLKFHELRHTQATLLLAQRVDVKTVQTRMGHADPTITLAYYAHAVPENDRDAGNLIGALFNSEYENVVDLPKRA